MKYLLENTDENHYATLKEIQDYLSKLDMNADRRTLYNDIDALADFGLDILKVKGNDAGYAVGSRDFELPELKLLVDCVQSARSITEEKSLELIKKIRNLASRYEAKELNHEMCVSGRVKTQNEKIYYNIDSIAKAVRQDNPIKFKYFHYNQNKQKTYKDYNEVSPFALIVNSENYYVLAWNDDKEKSENEQREQMRNYRVDRMENILILEGKERKGKEEFEKVDLARYSSYQVFNMFRGERQRVQLRFKNDVSHVAIDRFGMDIIMSPDGDEHFIVSVDVEVSPQFFGWIFSLGGGVEIIHPQSTIDELLEFGRNVLAAYEKK